MVNNFSASERTKAFLPFFFFSLHQCFNFSFSAFSCWAFYFISQFCSYRAWFHKSFPEEASTEEVAREGVRAVSIFSLTISQCYSKQEILVAIITGNFHPYLCHIFCVLPSSEICLLKSQEQGCGGECILYEW